LTVDTPRMAAGEMEASPQIAAEEMESPE
jgi:hypothetical protein